MPDLSHFWQRFLLATALLFGLALGVGATVFGYSNTGPVDVGWSVFQLRGIPLWTVVIVPLALVLVVGTLFHWWNSLHHFTEHMRHRRRVHELEAEVKSLRKHLDELLQMPDTTELTPTIAPEPAASNGDEKVAVKAVKAETEPEPELEPAEASENGSAETEKAPAMPPTAGS